MVTTNNTRLPQDAIDSFDRDGYFALEGIFTNTDLQLAIDEIAAAIDSGASAALKAGKLSRLYTEKSFEQRLTYITAENDDVRKGILAGRLTGPGIFGMITHTGLLDVIEQLCGPELISSSVYRLRPKLPGHSWGPVPWHQDSGYFEPYCDNSLIITVWIPLVDATEANGCMWVLPGAHKGSVLRHAEHPGKVYLEIPKEVLPKKKAVCVPIRKGGALFMTNRTPHASFDNVTDGIRWSMDLRYQSSKVISNARFTRYIDEPIPEGNVPPACYPPEADFLVRSTSRPEQVLHTPEEFKKLRETHHSKPLSNRWNAATVIS